MTGEISKVYQPKEVEAAALRIWEQGNFFHAEPPSKGGPDTESYTIVIPPPNVTGALHMGHAIDNTLQDVLIRYRRMQGLNTLWMPGTDHAGIATQSVVEKRLREEQGKTRHDVGREKLVDMIWQWKNEYGNKILEQLKYIGASCDWARTRFTLDEMCARAVRRTFSNLFRKGLIYRGKRLVNWDPVLHTAVADDEVIHKTVQGSFWYIRYPLADGNGHVTVATTRPETMLGDTAVAVNPKDERAMGLIGKEVMLPLMDRRIPIIADDYVKRGEGTGFLKVTPAHDPNDYEIGLRHDLEQINIFNPDATVNENGGRYEGLDRYDARKAVVEDLEKLGLLERVESREHEVGHSDRSGAPIEPYLSDQWFVKVGPLAKKAIEAVESGKVRFHPERYGRTYLDWLYGIRDWCISRQLWWGHRIPVWSLVVDMPQGEGDSSVKQKRPEFGEVVDEEQCGVHELSKVEMDALSRAVGRDFMSHTADDGQFYMAAENAADEPGRVRIYVCPEDENAGLEAKLEAAGFEQDPDVLDTWFSSALWPHSTLGWPDETDELGFYYPTSTLVTARDIITLWVSRMVMMGLENMGEVPFSDVFIHGTILDGNGERMSKSKGNGIDPLDIIETYGADAMRFSLEMMTTESQDMRLPVTKDDQGRNTSEKFDIGRNFCNKLWNASRFAMMNLEGTDPAKFDASKMNITDRWILSRLAATVGDVTSLLDEFKFNEPLSAAYHFFWHDLCDWYLEWAKPRMNDPEDKDTAQNVLAFVLDQTLRLLHPFVPFITEGIFTNLRSIVPVIGLKDVAGAESAKGLVVAKWPAGLEHLEDPDIELGVSTVQSITRAIREIRNQYNVKPSARLDACASGPEQITSAVNEHSELICQLANLKSFRAGADVSKAENAAATIVDELSVYVDDVIDPDEERKRLEKQRDQILKYIKPVEGKLGNENFVNKAKPEVVKQARDKLQELKEQLAAVEEHLGKL